MLFLLNHLQLHRYESFLNKPVWCSLKWHPEPGHESEQSLATVPTLLGLWSGCGVKQMAVRGPPTPQCSVEERTATYYVQSGVCCLGFLNGNSSRSLGVLRHHISPHGGELESKNNARVTRGDLRSQMIQFNWIVFNHKRCHVITETVSAVVSIIRHTPGTFSSIVLTFLFVIRIDIPK